MTVVIKNENPKRYFAKHMVQGVAEYLGEDGEMFRLIAKNEAIKSMEKSFEGKPVVVFHQDIDKENLKDQMDGVVVKSFYNKSDGWHWTEIVAITDAAVEAIENNKWSVSNSYLPKLKEVQGTYLNVDYDCELEGGSYDHLAIVPDPRYEDSIILTPDEFRAYNEDLENRMLNNSKENKGNKVKLNFFTKTPEEKEVDSANTFLKLENGKEISLKDMIKTVENSEKEEEKKENEKDDKDLLDQMVEVGDKKMKVSELVNKYKNMSEKDEKKDNEKEEEELDNEKEEEKKEEEIENSKFSFKNEEEFNNAMAEKLKDTGSFEEIKKLINNGQEETAVKVETEMTKIARGKEKY